MMMMMMIVSLWSVGQCEGRGPDFDAEAECLWTSKCKVTSNEAMQFTDRTAGARRERSMATMTAS